MRTTSHAIGTIYYPDEICFAFNPTYIKITGCSATSVTTTVATTAGKSHQQISMVYSNACVINIARTLQLLFDTYNIVNARALGINVSVQAGSSTFGFHTVAIWGNIAPGEVFNGARTVRWFMNYPMSISIFTGDAFEEKALSLNVRYDTSPWDYTFDHTFRARLTEEIDVVGDERKDGLFLRWIDRHGMLQFWLFEKGVKEIKNDDSGNELTMNYVDQSGNSFRSIKRQQSFFSTNTQYLCATNVNAEEYTMLESILTSPVIDLYHPDSAGWEPVIIVNTTTKRDVKVLQDFECRIALPNTNAQSL